ncbi:M23 family metallopeptidase [Kordiimonas sp. SCSIO 12603]|uniref:M23 family metallopeptidase n=1 Tax=Kordiimonas sp. SCSIO 12603 TaxID=2829596 RepID=UPI0021022883|nr:M23 family metallopeptidase [Kordiimonas sp. SCSIO 12603]UTW58767.1 M23 family metallopeptidase [Kordiimonas sp. SCSIO 12603]
MKRFFLVAIFVLCGANAYAFQDHSGLRIQVDPGEKVFANKITQDRAIYDILLQNLWISNDSDKTLKIDKVTISVLRKERVLIERYIETSAIRASAKQIVRLEKAGALDLYDFQFRTREQKTAGMSLATSEKLVPSETILMIHQYLTVQGKPDTVKITVHALTEDGSKVAASHHLDVAIKPHNSDFIFPLKGDWYIAVGPDVRGHHRWNVASEFALDIVKLGENGASFSGSTGKNTNYFAYGAPVRAVADGVIVGMKSDVREDESLLRQTGESVEAHEERSSTAQTELLLQGADGIAGNYVIIKHKGGSYSQYAHLRPGSLRVKIGERVVQGDIIGEVGNSGNSSEPHLHFQVTDGPDVLYARGLPVTFRRISNPWTDLNDAVLLTGTVVHAK